MSQVGTATIGTRVIELHAFTGEVVDQEKSTETTTVHRNQQVTSHTDTATHLFVRSPDGEERDLQVWNMKIGVRRGNTVSLVWGIKQGETKGDYIAVFNHDTNSVHHIRKPNNDLAGPPMYNMLLIGAVIVGMVGVFDLFGGNLSGAFFALAIGGGGIYYIYSRQKKLMAAVTALTPTLKVARPAVV